MPMPFSASNGLMMSPAMAAATVSQFGMVRVFRSQPAARSARTTSAIFAGSDNASLGVAGNVATEFEEIRQAQRKVVVGFRMRQKNCPQTHRLPRKIRPPLRANAATTVRP